MHHTRIAVLASLLVALIVAAGQALAGLPNIELVTFLVFVSGYLLGAPMGAAVGAASMGIHSLFNSMGAAVPPILVVQVLSYAAVGAIGGMTGRMIVDQKQVLVGTLFAGVLGFAITLGYQFPVNMATFYVFTNDGALWPYIWGGIVFSGIHMMWNTVLFMAAMRPTLSAIAGRREQLRTGR